MTRTENEAFEAMVSHHRALEEDLGRRVASLVGTVASGTAFEPAAAEVVAYFASDVLPHALAEEESIYRAAGRNAGLKATIAAMEHEHQALVATAERLARSTAGGEAKELAESLARDFSAHVAKENGIILPRLLADDHVDLAKLLVEMHRQLEAGDHGRAPAKRADALEGIVVLLLQSADDLAGAGHGDRACRTVASAWAALRGERPELAVRLTAALHRLVRQVTAEPVTLKATKEGRHGTDALLDVRSLAPAQRHEAIFASYAALPAGAGFVLVNDHDPKPLQYQFEAEHAGEHTWDYLEAGPEVWRVRIGRPPAKAETEGAEGIEPDLDVRRLAHGRRHEVIFSTYAALAPGTGFVLVNDHDPRPLRYQFEAQHTGEYTWDYLEAGPEIWRVRIGRAGVLAAR